MIKKVHNTPRNYFEYLIRASTIDRKLKGIRWKVREIYLPLSTKRRYTTLLTEYISQFKLHYSTSVSPTSDTPVRMQDGTQLPPSLPNILLAPIIASGSGSAANQYDSGQPEQTEIMKTDEKEAYCY